MGIAAQAVSFCTVFEEFCMVICIISTLCSLGMKDVTVEHSRWMTEERLKVCHINPALSSLSSCVAENLAFSCSAEEPAAEYAPSFSGMNQKLRVERLLCRFSALTGSNRKVS